MLIKRSREGKENNVIPIHAELWAQSLTGEGKPF